MESLMIGAIPAQDDPVWKISSEKVPHLTICYFGEQPDGLDLTRVQEYLQHAINTSLTRFGLSVDRRGVLGDDEADVLFFDKSYAREITEFRSLLLKNDEINKLYNSVDQYPEWTPHLTLGYPATPAHPDQRDYPGISWVNFDRIALWTGDYEGPEFILPTQDHSLEVAMSDNLDDFMAHFGVKGMKWGVTNNTVGLSSSRGELLVATPKDSGPPSRKDAAQATKAASHITASLMCDPKRGVMRPDGPGMKLSMSMAQKYGSQENAPKAAIDSYKKQMLSIMNSEAASHAPEGAHARVIESGEDLVVIVGKKEHVNDLASELSHQDVSASTTRMRFKYDDKGWINGLTVVGGSITHGDVDAFFAHFGIKGMHWGVRRSKAELAKTSSTEEDRPSIDPIAAKAAAVKRGASTAILTNDELSRVINRIDMERKLSGLLADEPKARPGRAFVKNLLLKEGKHQIERSTRLVVTQQIDNVLEKHGVPVKSGKDKKKK